jgi:spermidine/putrescine transport system substrate-binding protein
MSRRLLRPAPFAPVDTAVAPHHAARVRPLVALAVAGGGLLSSCGTEGSTQTSDSCTSEDLSETEKQVVWSNWPAYIDPIKQADSTLKAFEKQTGITVDYAIDVNDNNDFYGKVRNQLGDCATTDATCSPSPTGWRRR